MNKYQNFYEKIDREKVYCITQKPEEHVAYRDLKYFIDNFKLHDKKCLEIGSARGIFQNIILDYTGLEVAESLAVFYKKPFFVLNKDGTFPFEDHTFEAIWTWEVYEHIPDLNQALFELKRILKPGGVALFAPAWQARPWAAEGYAVRPYSDFGLKGKLIKASIPLRNTLFWRYLFIFPKRIYGRFLFILGKNYNKMTYKKLVPNYDHYWVSDSDACNCIESHDAILWFESNGFKCLSHPTHIKALLSRGPLIFRKDNER